MKPHDYQREGILEIIEKFKTKNKILYQLDTGGGKTVVFSFLSKYWSERRGEKILITCHREELVDQTCETLAKMDLTFSKITASTRKFNKDSEVFVAMIETINNRLDRGVIDLPEIGLVISDEAHVLVFDKVYKHFLKSKILGVSATPVVLKKINFCKCIHCKKEYDNIVECCGEEVEEWTKPFSMSMIYEDVVVGPKINFLIDFGQLVPELSFVKKYSQDADLKEDKDGEFTTKSQDKAFGSDEAVFNVSLNWKQYCEGKRTIVFNSSAKTNKLVHDALKEAGANVKLFDSVNKDEKISRRQLIKWFRETPDAVLCNVNIFTAGFDCKEVEAVMINRSTNSLSLFLQMTGRGGRSSQKIYKPHFVLVDGGGNIERFGEWSDPTRDWKKLFFEGLGKPKAKKIDSESIQSCDNCGALFGKKEYQCPMCGEIPQPTEPSQIVTKVSDTILFPIKQIPHPDGHKIYDYTKKMNENIHFAHKIMINQIVDMFRYYGVTKELYEKVKITRELDVKVTKMIRKCYFVLLSKTDIHTGQNRTLAYLINKAKEKLEIFYYG